MSDNYSVMYSPQAKDDLKEIYSYIAFTLLASPAAERQVNKIRETIRSLDFMPMRNPVVDWEPWKSMEIRKAMADNFVIFYIADESSLTVTIIRIIYGGRDIAGIASDTENK